MIFCFLGDSIVNGLRDEECKGWAGRLCAELCAAGKNVTCYNLGVRREKSLEVSQRWQAESAARELSFEETRYVFSYGTGDMAVREGKQGASLEEVEANTRKILESCQKSKTLFVGPPPVANPEHTARNSELSDRLQVLCDEYSVPFCNMFEHIEDLTAYVQNVVASDGIHPSGAGYEMIAKAVAAWKPWQKFVQE